MKPTMLALSADVARLLAAGAAQAPNDDGLRARAAAVRRLADRAAALRPVADAVEQVQSADPKRAVVALLDLSVVLLRARAALTDSGCDGELEPVPESGPWRNDLSADEVWVAADNLRKTGKGRGLEFPKIFTGPRCDVRLVDLLLRGLNDRYDALAEFVAEKALPAYGRAILPDLCAALNLRGKSVDGRRLVAICRIDKRRGLRLCRQALGQGSPTVRAWALRCLPLVADADEVNAAVVAAFAEKTPDVVRRAAVDVAGQLHHYTEACAAALVAGLRADYRVRWRLRQVIPRIGPAAVPHLIDLLKDPQNPEPLEPIWALRDFGPAAAPAVDALLPLLDSPTQWVCNNVIGALAAIGPPARAALPRLRRLLPAAGQTSPGTPPAPGRFGGTADALEQRRQVIADALIRISGKPEPGISILIECLASPCIHCRRDAVESLGRLGQTARRAIPALIDVLTDDGRHVRHFAARALARIGAGTEACIPTLIEMTRHPTYFVRGAAVEALGAYGPTAAAALPALREVPSFDRSKWMSERLTAAIAAIDGTGPPVRIELE